MGRASLTGALPGIPTLTYKDKNMSLQTKSLHAGYNPKNSDSRVVPIYQSTTFVYDNPAEVADLFDLRKFGHFYTRISNPTVDAVEQKINALEGGVGALLTSCGQAATFTAIFTIAKNGDHIVSSSSIYGGSLALIANTLKRCGISVTFIDQEAPDQEIERAFQSNTVACYAETLANPSCRVLDIERMARIAHKFHVPLIIDNTFSTPFLTRPIEHGADIVVHSTSKYMDGHAITLGGAVVDSGNFDWTLGGKFPEFTAPDPAYHGLIFSQSFGKLAYIVKARVQVMRDIGPCTTPQAAFYLNQGLETLGLRIERHSENAYKVASFLKSHPKVELVRFAALEDSPYYELCKKYMKGKGTGIISFDVKGGREAGVKLIKAFKLIALEVHISDIKSSVLHPASSSHRQLSDEQLEACGVTPGLIRLNVGLEDADDIIEDLRQALDSI